jgi:hypothetical protein
MKSQSEDEYDYADYDYNDDLTKSENIIASRRSFFPNLDSEYYEAIQTLSLRVKCPACEAQRKQVCRVTMNGEPAHRARILLLTSQSEKVFANLKYAMNSKKWKGGNVIVKVKGKYDLVSVNDVRWRRLVRETYGEICEDTHRI